MREHISYIFYISYRWQKVQSLWRFQQIALSLNFEFVHTCICFCCFSTIFLGRISLVFICSKSQNVKFAIWLLKSWFLRCFFFWLFPFSLVCWLILPHFAVLNFSFTLLFSDTLDGQKIEGERRRKAIKTSRPKEKSPRKLRRTVACPYVPKKKKKNHVYMSWMGGGCSTSHIIYHI